MKPTKKAATPTPEPEAIDLPAVEETAAVSEMPAPEVEPTSAEDVEPAQENVSETASPSPVEGGETEVIDGGEAPQAETASEEEAPADPEPAVEETADEPEPAEDPALIDNGATSAAWMEVSLGPVACRARNMSVDDVLGCLPEAGIDRVKVLTGEPSIHSLAKRMLGSDGRCTPAVFSGEDGPEHIIDGYETIAAALVSGTSEIPVILVEPSRVGFIQSYISSRSLGSAPAPSQEDDLLWRVNGLAI